MKHLLKIVAVLTVLAAQTVFAAQPATDAGTRRDIEKLLEISGALSVGSQMADLAATQMQDAIEAARPDLPPRLLRILHEEVDAVVRENLSAYVASIVPVYAKYYTHDEIRALIRFYQSELGRKTVRIMPQLLRETVALGRQWGQALAPQIKRRILQRFKAEGVDLSS